MNADSSSSPVAKNLSKASSPKSNLPSEKSERTVKKRSTKISGSSSLAVYGERKPDHKSRVGVINWKDQKQDGSSLSIRYDELGNRIAKTGSKNVAERRLVPASLGKNKFSHASRQNLEPVDSFKQNHQHQLRPLFSTNKLTGPPSRPSSAKQGSTRSHKVTLSSPPTKSRNANSRKFRSSSTFGDATVQHSESTVSDISNVIVNDFTGQYTHPYFALPEAVRVKILKYLTPTERLLAQFVCRRMRNDIRLRVGIRTKVTEGTLNGVTFLRDVYVTSLWVGKFDRPQTPPSKLIFTPEHVFELIFAEPICMQHIDAFLCRCRKLKWLIIRCPVKDSPSFSATFKNPYSAFEWRTVDAIHKMPILQPSLVEVVLSIPASQCLRSVNRVLCMLNAPALKRFSIMIHEPITMDDTTAIHFAILNFLRNNLSVSNIMLNTIQKPSVMNPSARSSQFQFMEREINQSIEDLQLRQVILTEPAVSFALWNTALRKQTSLEVFQVLHMTIWPSLRDILVQNFRTLVTVAIHVILWDKYGRHFPTDLAAFSKCNCLKELYICIAPSPIWESSPKNVHTANILNFDKLPRQLEILALKHCQLSMKDFISVRNLQDLKCLGVLHNGTHSDGNYIGVQMLKTLLQMRSLDELFLSGLETKVEEVDEIKSMMRQLKIRVSLNKKKHLTHLHCCFSQYNSRWIMQKSGAVVFAILSTWGLPNV